MLSRRTVVGTLMASSLTALAEARPLTFVLVPGAWHGGWAFERVGRLLEAQGHSVDAVTLPGLAERKGELDASIRLKSHIDDVRGRVERATTPVVLVGHSYAGMVVTPVAAALPARLARLVYLDAFIPTPGSSMLSLMKQAYSDKWRAKAKAVSQGLWVPPMLDAKAMGIGDPKDAALVDGRLTPHPMATLEDPVSFDEAALASVERRYVWCAKYPGFKRYADQARAKSWDVRELPAGHDAMWTHPEATAAALT
ncbi:MAG: alpha/beta hydrolase [Myxococcaceae bacterium]|jgi:pimeloyl-ACP methyl ester carboxylesterase|nr:alpha/beta hydrolase [Myxococcaceae bacterium]